MSAGTMTHVTDPEAINEAITEAQTEARRARAIAKQRAENTARRRALVGRLMGMGLTHSQIAVLLDLSRQRVTQYAEELRDEAAKRGRTD